MRMERIGRIVGKRGGMLDWLAWDYLFEEVIWWILCMEELDLCF